MDTRQWVGRSGLVIQIMLSATIISLFAVVVWATIYVNETGQMDGYGFWFVVMWIFVLAGCGVGVWGVRYLSPMMVVMDDGGLMLRRGGKSRSIGWGDVDVVSYFPPGMYQGPTIMVYPKSEFFTRLGKVVPGDVKLGLEWAIPQTSFSQVQMDQMLDSFRYFAWRAGQSPDSQAGQRPLPGPARPLRVEVFGG